MRKSRGGEVTGSFIEKQLSLLVKYQLEAGTEFTIDFLIYIREICPTTFKRYETHMIDQKTNTNEYISVSIMCGSIRP